MQFSLFRKNPPILSPEEKKMKEAEELKKVIETIDEVPKGECTTCKFALVFALIIFFIVVFFVFFLRLDAPLAFAPLPPEKTPPPHDIDQKERDLVATSALSAGYVIVER